MSETDTHGRATPHATRASGSHHDALSDTSCIRCLIGFSAVEYLAILIAIAIIVRMQSRKMTSEPIEVYVLCASSRAFHSVFVLMSLLLCVISPSEVDVISPVHCSAVHDCMADMLQWLIKTVGLRKKFVLRI